MATKLAFDLIANDKATRQIDRFLTDIKGKLFSFQSAIAAVGVGLTGREIISTADQYSELAGRLRLVTESEAELAEIEERLFDLSQESRVGYGQTVDLYTRLARSTRDLKLSQEDLLEVTEAINKSLIISGASAEAADAALIQLGQGLASGTLRGEELNSVLEQAPRLAEALARGMGVTIGELRALGKEGKITAEKVVQALRAQAGAINDEFTRMPKTVGQAMTVLDNSIGRLISGTDRAGGVTGILAEKISDLAEKMDNLDQETVNLIGRDIAYFFELAGESARAMGEGVAWALDRIRAFDAYISGKLDKPASDAWAERQVQKIEALSSALEQLRRSNTPNKETYIARMERELALAMAQMDVFQAELAGSLFQAAAGKPEPEKGRESVPESLPHITPTSRKEKVELTPAQIEARGAKEDAEALRLAKERAEIEKQLALVLLPEEQRAAERIRQEYDMWRDAVKKLGLSKEEEAEKLAILNQREKEALRELAVGVDSFTDHMIQAIREWSSSFSQALTDMVWEADLAFGDILESFGRMITGMMMQKMVVDPIINDITGWLDGGGIIDVAEFFGNSDLGWMQSIGGFLVDGFRAYGGPVSPGGVYRVNELGPEVVTVAGKDYLMMGNQGGTVTPVAKDAAGGSGVTVINVFDRSELSALVASEMARNRQVIVNAMTETQRDMRI